jgi:hypothetical protein
VAVIVAAIVIGFVLHRFIEGQIDQRLDTQIVFLSSMLTAASDGTIALAGNADGPPFDRPARGWYWQVAGPKNALRSRSLEGHGIDMPPVHRPPRHDFRRRSRISTAPVPTRVRRRRMAWGRVTPCCITASRRSPSARRR